MLAFCTIILAQSLTFQEAAELTLEKSPDLQLKADAVGRRIGDHAQAMMRPNPVFTYAVENVLGNREWQGWRNAKSEYDLTQAIETGGKRYYRTQAAAFAVNAAEEELEVARIAALNQLKKLFIQTAGNQELLRLAEQRAANGEEILKNLQAQIEEGKGKPLLLQKMKIQLAHILYAQEKAKGNLRLSREELALSWGDPCPEFDQVTFDLFNLENPGMSPETPTQDHPLLQQWELRRRSTEAGVMYQKALAVPDFLLTVGYKVEKQNRGLALQLSFPLPVFDRNHGNILKAEFDEQSAITQLTASQTLLQTQLRNAVKETLRNSKEAIYLRDHILKAAQDALQISLEGLKEGKSTPLDVLEARQTVFDMEEQYLLALIKTHQAQVDIDYLIPYSSQGTP